MQHVRPPPTRQPVQRKRSAATVPWAVRRALLRASRPVRLPANAVLFHAGDAGDGCYFLRRGAVKASVVAKDGQERLLAVLGPGALIGEFSLIDDAPRSATIVALKPCLLLHLSKPAFFRVADANPLVYREALTILTQRLRQTNDAMVAQGTVPVVGRVARAFLALAQGLGARREKGGILLADRITQTDIAGLAGVARENASRAVNDLLREGVLAREGQHYVITDPEALAELAEI